MVDISVKDLTKFFVIGDNLLDHVTFEIYEGERVAILGRNGCGKTTLFRILTNEIDYDFGEVYINPNKKVGLISQIPVFPENFTVEDVLHSAYTEIMQIHRKMLRIEEQMQTDAADDELLKEYDLLSTRFQTGGGYEIDFEVDKICNGLGISSAQRSQLFVNLSGGEKTRVNLGRLLLEKTEILLLDEPTNHLDLTSVEWLEKYIASFKGTVVIISHDRYFIDCVARRVIEISDGHAEFYSGNYTFYMNEKQARFDLQMKQYEQEQAKLKQLGYTVERMKGWGINNRTLYRRAMSIRHRMERMQRTSKPKAERTLKVGFDEKSFSGDVVFKVKNLTKSFDNRLLFSNINLQVSGGERIALLGDNGAGKTTFLKCLLGEIPSVGKVQFGPTIKAAYLPQIIQFSHPERTLYDTMLYEKNCSPQFARDRLGAFMFQGEDVYKSVASLSGGEKSRLRLCMLMDEKVNLLILDEPTNHLDIASREWIEAAIEEFEGTLLFISHDRYFIEKFAERIWLLQDKTLRDFNCGYTKYRSILDHEEAEKQLRPQPCEKGKKDFTVNKGKANEKTVKKLERDIERVEKYIADIDNQINNLQSDYQEIARLLQEKEASENELMLLMEQWDQAVSN